jgi:hypothetical protein
MPDISMCTNIFCPLRETCYRAKAKPSMYQSYAPFTYDKKKKDCEYYMEIKPKTNT